MKKVKSSTFIGRISETPVEVGYTAMKGENSNVQRQKTYRNFWNG